MSVATEPQPSGPTPVADLRPRLRGHIHFWSFFGAVACAAALISLAAATVSPLAALATSVYGLTVLGVFGVSALYHRRFWSPAAYKWMKRADHSMIFLFIAGTYTPFTLLAMSKPTGYVILGIVWGGALAGVSLKMLWPHAPRWLGIPIYIALGWVAIFVMPELATHAGVAALVLLCVGGALYTFNDSPALRTNPLSNQRYTGRPEGEYKSVRRLEIASQSGRAASPIFLPSK